MPTRPPANTSERADLPGAIWHGQRHHRPVKQFYFEHPTKDRFQFKGSVEICLKLSFETAQMLTSKATTKRFLPSNQFLAGDAKGKQTKQWTTTLINIHRSCCQVQLANSHKGIDFLKQRQELVVFSASLSSRSTRPP